MSPSGGWWGRGELVALAHAKCTFCHGRGMTWRRAATNSSDHCWRPCLCAYRRVFDICWRRYVYSCYELRPRDRRNEEYRADLERVASRTLRRELRQVWRLHFLLGADWKVCAARLRLNRKQTWDRIYRVKEILGRTWAETAPYALWPVGCYYAGVLSRRRFAGEASNGNGDRPVLAKLLREALAEGPMTMDAMLMRFRLRGLELGREEIDDALQGMKRTTTLPRVRRLADGMWVMETEHECAA